MVRPQILVVEDDAAMRDLVRDTLREGGYDVRVFDCGARALDALHEAVSRGQKVPSVLVSDLSMPGMSGLDTVRQLRAIGCEMYVFLMTAFGTSNLREEAYRLGVIEVFDKPFDLDSLVDAIRRLDTGP